MGTESENSRQVNVHDAVTISDRIAEHLLEHIREKKLVAGDALPSERELMRQFNISRLACREGLAKLRGMGIIRVRHGKGVYFADLQDQALPGTLLQMLQVHGEITNESILEIRQLIEPTSARWAAQRGSEQQKQTIFKQAKAMETNLSIVGAVERAQQFAQADVGFHQAVAIASNNKILPMIYRGLHELLLRVRLEVLILTPNILFRAVADHLKIAEAIRAGDPKTAEKAMERHIRLRGRELLEKTTEQDKALGRSTRAR